MKGKEYKKPAIEIVELELENHLALFLGSIADIGGAADPSIEPLSNGRRGTWGDLWADVDDE